MVRVRAKIRKCRRIFDEKFFRNDKIPIGKFLDEKFFHKHKIPIGILEKQDSRSSMPSSQTARLIDPIDATTTS